MNIFEKMRLLNLAYRQTLLVFTDIVVVAFSLQLTFLVHSDVYAQSSLWKYYAVIIPIMLISFWINKLYSSLWQYASIEELLLIARGTVLGFTASYITFRILGVQEYSGLLITFLAFSTLAVGASRFSYRLFRRAKMGFTAKQFQRYRVMVIGAGQAGAMVIKELLESSETYKYPVAVIDDDYCKVKCNIHGIPVVGTRDDIITAAEQLKIDEIIIAMPSVGRNEIKRILELCKQTNCKVKTLPGMYELIDGKIDINKIRDVEIEDLLGRDPVEVNLGEISDYIYDETVLVTGGGGSIGSELCRQISKFAPKKLIILDNYENNAYDIQQELKRQHKTKLDMEVIIASIREKERVEEIFSTYKPNVIFHAAAHKHVPLMEKSPLEAIKNNVFGTQNVVNAAHKHKAKRFVLISTDKAVNPTNIMGATKRLAEKIIQTMDKQSETEFVAVRFGNVLGSNGSVIPLFKKQIAEGGPVTVTHPKITRFFMTIPEAVQLVIQAGSMAKGGEIFVLDMGEPVKIADLAKDLISLSGFDPDNEIEIKFSGLRPGEKLYEELLMDEEGLKSTYHEKIFVGKPLISNPQEILETLKYLRKLAEKGEQLPSLEILKTLVPTYQKQQIKKTN
ncbi:nucleoside-diphosphate sugar epimerase/dehydratase [Proteinivorax hydrogeniformans]|uniref:Nucleoside-diphosphate sugar epimerase/dehydratase n=2 Tax=Proteinivorax hydrogeniformans TaxID=1826727 RepID=A0AAU8HX83_9FIRM